MNLEYEFTFNATTKGPVQIGAGPYGTRFVMEVTGGSLEGKRIKGKVLTGGGDWFLVGPDGWGRVDVRGQFLTDDGAGIYTAYTGLLEMNEKIQRAIVAGSGTDYRDQYFRTTPRFETGDPRYAWLNQAVFVAEGRLMPQAVEYKVYRVT
jgi:hypothetical protein